MKIRIILTVLFAVFVSACSAPPPVTGTFTTKDGQIRVHPDGRFEIIVEPRTSK
jgi:hypothetical protein